MTENEKLLKAAKEGNLAAVASAVVNGAEVDSMDASHKCALMYACKGGHYFIVRGLLEHGASVFSADLTGNTALYYAQHSGSQATHELMKLAVSRACIEARLPSIRIPTPQVVDTLELDFDMCFASTPSSRPPRLAVASRSSLYTQAIAQPSPEDRTK